MSLVKVEKATDFPIEAEERKCTDIFCAAFGICFTLLLIILALSLKNTNHLIKTAYPSDSIGRVCGLDFPKHPYLYFTSMPSPIHRVCVTQCPKKGDTALSCVPTAEIGCSFNPDPKFYVGYYETKEQQTSVGNYCLPTDQKKKQQLFENMNVEKRFNFFEKIKTITISCLIAVGVSLLYIVLLQHYPKQTTIYTIGFGALIMLVTLIFVLVFPSSHIYIRIPFALILLLLLITVFLAWRKSKGTIKLYQQFMSHASDMISKNYCLITYVPIFLAIIVLFLMITMAEAQYLWSSVDIYFDYNSIFYYFKSDTLIWTTIVFIQIIWGLTWIKEAFNFCISGNTVEWYYSRFNENSSTAGIFTPLKYLIKSHFGSIVAGSFMTGWFSIPDYIFDCFRSDEPPSNEDNCCSSCINWVDDFFDLVRSDAMCYVYLTGNPYCNSSRYCEYLCDQSPLTKNSQSISRAYRICAHFLIAGIVSSINIFQQGSDVSVFIVLVAFIMSLFLSTFFISMHSDAAESIQIMFLMDEHFASKEVPEDQRNQLNDQIIKKMKLNKELASQISKIHSELQP